jgi:6-phosphofructokinase 1
VYEKIKEREARGNKFTIVVVAEGASPVGGDYSVVEKEAGRAMRLGGVGEKVEAALRDISGKETRLVVLGHLLRGGSPTSFDRLTALRFGAAAVRGLEDGQSGVMVALDPPDVKYVPIEEAMGKMKMVPMDSDIVLTAQDLGISFG